MNTIYWKIFKALYSGSWLVECWLFVRHSGNSSDVTLAFEDNQGIPFKEDIRKDIQKIYKDNTDNQATLRDNIERVTDDFSNLSESLDIFKELTTNKVKFLRVSIQNQKQTFNCVYCNNIFENDNELIKHNEHYPLACEECNMCFERRLPGKIIHSRHDHSSKRKLLVV